MLEAMRNYTVAGLGKVETFSNAIVGKCGGCAVSYLGTTEGNSTVQKVMKVALTLSLVAAATFFAFKGACLLAPRVTAVLANPTQLKFW